MGKHETVDAFEASYLCSFRPEPEGGFTVTRRAFPEIVTFGIDIAEARAMAREAIELCIEVYREEGRPLPPSEQETIPELIPVRLVGT
jgi:predicted RNase H-like HicB family nuclease